MPNVRCFRYIVETCTAAGKIAGGFTRGGDPSSLLSHGFALVGLSGGRDERRRMRPPANPPPGTVARRVVLGSDVSGPPIDARL